MDCILHLVNKLFTLINYLLDVCELLGVIIKRTCICDLSHLCMQADTVHIQETQQVFGHLRHNKKCTCIALYIKKSNQAVYFNVSIKTFHNKVFQVSKYDVFPSDSVRRGQDVD